MKDDVNRLLVIGAGPKAAAIVAKAKILKDLSKPSPEIWVIDNKGLCANWTGQHGFTSGSQSLGTPPEKDIGFPYILDKEDPEITRRLFAEYSWPSYLNFDRCGYGEWIDRGRPHPTHKEWARYLSTVLESAARTIIGECTKIEADGDQWIVEFREKRKHPRTERFSGIVFTGPGERKMPAGLEIPDINKILYGDSFWHETSRIDMIDKDDGSLPVVVVGGGETAAAIVSYLVDELAGTNANIIVLTRSGAIFSRGEGYYENRRFTDSTDWKSLPLTVREEVIKRGDRGVFSVEAMQKISNSRNVHHRFLDVRNLGIRKSGARKNVVVNPGSRNEEIHCQLLIMALGFDPFWFSDHISGEIGERLRGLKNSQIEENIEQDLSLSSDICPAKIFLPMVSGLAQGPGFPNLSCLGNLSDRILGRN